jgi:hypothetical protein
MKKVFFSNQMEMMIVISFQSHASVSSATTTRSCFTHSLKKKPSDYKIIIAEANLSVSSVEKDVLQG